MNHSKKEEWRLIIITVFFIAVNILAILFVWQYPLTLTIYLVILTLVELWNIKSRKVLLVFIISAFGGSFVEIMAVHLGIWQYVLPEFFGIPIWLIPAWGNAGIIIVCFYKLFSQVSWLEKK